MPTIEVNPATYDRLARRATAARVTVEELLNDLALPVVGPSANEHLGSKSPHDLSLDEFRRLLKAAAVEMPGVPPLPDDFSRADLYDDHD